MGSPQCVLSRHLTFSAWRCMWRRTMAVITITITITITVITLMSHTKPAVSTQQSLA